MTGEKGSFRVIGASLSALERVAERGETLKSPLDSRFVLPKRIGVPKITSKTGNGLDNAAFFRFKRNPLSLRVEDGSNEVVGSLLLKRSPKASMMTA